MVGPSPQCYIPNFVEIVSLVPKIFFEGFSLNMRVAAMLVMLSKCHEDTFIPPTHRGSTQNLDLIGQVVSENMFEHCG